MTTVKGTPPTVLDTRNHVSSRGYDSQRGTGTHMLVEYSFWPSLKMGSVKLLWLVKARRRRLWARGCDLIVVCKRSAAAKWTAEEAESTNARSEG
jgi:hypothetical protein